MVLCVYIGFVCVHCVCTVVPRTICIFMQTDVLFCSSVGDVYMATLLPRNLAVNDNENLTCLWLLKEDSASAVPEQVAFGILAGVCVCVCVTG